MKKPALVSALLLACASFVGCAKDDATNPAVLGNATVEGKAPLVLDDTFEFQLGQGSGMDGLNMIKIGADGTAVYQYGAKNAVHRKEFVVDPQRLQDLVAKINALKIMSMDKAYHEPGVADGTQWCLLIRTGGRAKSIYCDNRFPKPIEQLAEVVHQTIITPLAAKVNATPVSDEAYWSFQKELWDSVK